MCTNDDLRRMKLDVEQGYMIEPYAVKSLIARMEAGEACVDALDANYQTIADNSDEDDLAIVDGRLKAWRTSKGE